MNRTFFKIVFRSIRDSIVRFLAILAITALGVGFFSGLKAAMPSFIETGDKFIKEQKLFDLRLISSIGFDDDDLLEISKLNDVVAAEGASFKDVIVSHQKAGSATTEDGVSVVRVHTLTDNVNTLFVEEGRLPQAPNEIVVDSYQLGTSWVGDKIILDSQDGFTQSEFTIVGAVRSAYYLNFQRGNTDVGGGSIHFFAYCMPEAMDSEYYMEVFVKLNNDFYTYSDEYDDYIENYIDYAEVEVQRIIDARYDRMIDDAREEYNDAIKDFNEEMHDAMIELGDAYDELTDACKELQDAKKEIGDGVLELEDAKKQLEDSKKILGDAKSALDDAERQISDAEGVFATNKSQLDELGGVVNSLLPTLRELELKREEVKSSIDQINENLPILNSQIAALEQAYPVEVLMMSEDYLTLVGTRDTLMTSLPEAEDGLTSIDDGILEIKKLQDTYNKGLATYNAAYKEFENQKEDFSQAKIDYYNGVGEYNDGLSKYEDGQKELEDGIAEYNDGLNEYNDGYLEYLDGQREISSAAANVSLYLMHLDRYINDLADDSIDTYVLGRDTNLGYVSFDNDANIVDGIADVFPVFFFAIAALVCSTTMQRMVADERVQIGSMRALGYSSSVIAFKYIIYSGLAAVIGCVGGYLGGTKLFPYVIWQVYGMMYGFAPITYKNDYLVFAISLIVSLICSVGVTIATCIGELREQPAELVRPKAPGAGKRILLEKIGFIWKHLKFLHKVSARNVFRFKKRMWMMIIGIAGCTALVITGFGLKDSINNVVNFQYDEILTYDSLVVFDDDVSKSEIETMMSDTESKVGVNTQYAYINQKILTHNSETGIRSVELFASDDPNILNFINPHADGVQFEWPDDGKIGISSKLASANNFKAGDMITFEYGDNGESFEVEVAYVFENYIFHYAVMNANTYSKVFDEDYEARGILVNIPDDSGVTDYGFASELAQDSRVKSWTAISANRENFENTMNQLNLVVILVIACAAALAFIVLFNLNNINITERVREIATLKVLGFNRSETGSYVFRENTILVLLGFIVGIPLGIALHAFVMNQIAMDTVTFQIIILPMSYVVSLVTVMFFSVFVDFVMRFKIEKIDMAESLKSIE